jgi:hypothetical protein
MNMKSLTVVLGAITAFALGACTVTSTTSGSGGSTSATGTGGGTTTTTTGGVGGSGGAGGSTSATGTGGAASCEAYTCSEAITPPDGDPAKLCATGPHADLYDALAACTCTGACKDKCSTNTCANMAITADCTACLQDPAGCKAEFVACAGDAP